MPLSHRCCPKCGAVISLLSTEGGGFDNSRVHARWHRTETLVQCSIMLWFLALTAVAAAVVYAAG